MRRAEFILWLLAGAVLVWQGCGKIEGPNFPQVVSPRVIVTTPASPASGNIAISFALIDRELESADVLVQYSTDAGQTFHTAALTDPSDAVNLASDWFPGMTHSVQWNSVADMVGRSGALNVCVRIAPSDASNPSGTADITDPFTVNNIAYNQPPGVTMSTPAGVQSGNIQINYFLSDVESDTCSIVVDFSTDGGGTYQAATMGLAGDGLSGLASSPSGAANMFMWDSRTDNVGLAAQQDSVRIRITPTDFNEGAAGQTASFSVDNSTPNNPPTVSITSGPSQGATVYTPQVTFGWSGSDTDGTVTGYYCSFDHDPPDVWTADTSVTSGILSDGGHTFRVVAVDDEGALSTVASRTFTVSIAVVQADFTASPTSGTAPLTVGFTDTSTGSVTSWSWSFGDGGTATSQNPSHVYNSTGSFTVTLTVNGPDGSDTETKTNYITATSAGGDTWVRGTADCDFGPDDGNLKLIVEDNKIKLAPDGDEFGNWLDANWTKSLSGDMTATETGGEIQVNKNGNNASMVLLQRDGVAKFGDADVAAEFTYLSSAISLTDAQAQLCLRRDTSATNGLLVLYKVIGANHCVAVVSRINGEYNLVHVGSDIGAHSKIRLALRRDSSSNQFTGYYATWNTAMSSWNAWTQFWQGVVSDPTYFNQSHQLFPSFYLGVNASPMDWDPRINRYWQRTDVVPAQRFWNDSPECDIIDSSAGSPEYCLDAGTGNTWSLSAFSAVASEPGTSSVKLKAGYGDSASRASATWINSGNWLTAAQLNAQVASGALDGHRYVFLKAQFNSDGTDQPTLTSVTFTGTAGDVTYTATAFDTSPATIDNNEKVVVESGIAKLAPDGDNFGSVLDLTHWTKTESGGSISEGSGVVLFDKIGSGSSSGVITRSVTFVNADIVADWSKTAAAIKNYDAQVMCYLRKDGSNWVRASYSARRTVLRVLVEKGINGIYTAVYVGGNLGIQPTIKLRVKRIASTNTFTFYYDIGAGWVQMWSGVIYDATYFNYSDVLYPQAQSYCVATAETDYDPELTSFYQKTDDGIPAQRFWDDSPEILVVGTATVDWAFDASAGRVWQLSGASCVKTEPGTSSVEFKVGYSDTGNLADVAWVDATWRTIAQIDTNAAGGSYDGYRYIHVKAQFNSDGTDQPSLSSFSVHGAKIVP